MDIVSLLFGLEGRIGRAKYWLGQLVLFAIAFIAYLLLARSRVEKSVQQYG